MTSDEDAPLTVTTNARRQQWLCFGIALLAACVAAACESPAESSRTWRCDVTLRAEQVTFLGRFEITDSATGTGGSQEEALLAGRRAICEELDSHLVGQLSFDDRSRCERGLRPNNSGDFPIWNMQHSCSSS